MASTPDEDFSSTPDEEKEDRLVSIDFEVFGKVQGCYFTKYVRELCKELGLVGWVKNTKTGTILGKIQGPESLIDQMSEWLSTVGSPQSEIHHCEFSELQSLAKLGYKGFEVRF